MKHYHPTTPSRRHTSTPSFKKALSGDSPLKKLVMGGKRHVGRNNAGRITVRHKGGGHKRRFRMVDFKLEKMNIPARVATIEYDPNRSGFIGLLVYRDGEKRYALLPANVSVGETLLVAEKTEIKAGNRMSLANIPVGSFVYNLEVKPKGGAKLVRSAGTFAEVLSNDARYTSLKMPSGEVRKIHETCFASIGAVSNDEHKLRHFGKAGRSRWKGIRPTVRGTAMNPVDHPYGGGEGRQGRGTRRPKTAHGKITGGHKTRRSKKYSNKFIVSRRKSRKR